MDKNAPSAMFYLFQIFKKSLLSVSQLTDNKFSLLFDEDFCVIRDKRKGGKIVGEGIKVGGLYKFLVIPSTSESISFTPSHPHGNPEVPAETALHTCDPLNNKLWHARYGHLSSGGLSLLKSQNMVSGLPLIKKEFGICDICMLGKHTRSPFGSSNTSTSQKLEIVHSDICGPFPSSRTGALYYITFIDDFTRKLGYTS